MKTQLSFSGWDGTDDLGEGEKRLVRDEAETIMMKALLLYEREVKKQLSGRRSGRSYRFGSRMHIASAEGESPATLTSNLRNSIGHTGPTWSGDELLGEYGPGLGAAPASPGSDPDSYARRMEYGGIDSRGVRIGPRPYMEPVAQRVDPIVDSMFENAFK